eukprot:6182583-Pleurochrysis_carterae.AAC.1
MYPCGTCRCVHSTAADGALRATTSEVFGALWAGAEQDRRRGGGRRAGSGGGCGDGTEGVERAGRERFARGEAAQARTTSVS